jgi:NhaA family Na+:H+ antiporter
VSAEGGRRLDPPVDPRVDHVRGSGGQGTTIVEYGDFECPYCGEAYPNVRELERRLGDRVRIVFRHFPLAERHPHAELAALAAEAAAAQGRFWEMHDLLFENQRALERTDILSYADGLGLDRERFEADLESPELAARVARDLASGERSGVPGTPSFFIDGHLHRGFFDVESLEDAVSGR